MSYAFKDTKLEAIFLRKQEQREGQSLEDAWERTSWRRTMSRHNADLAVAAVLYLAAIFIAIGVVAASGVLTSPSGPGVGIQIIFGAAVFGTFVELLRRTYDTAIKRLATLDLFTSEVLSIMRVFVAANIVGEFIRLYDKVDSGQLDALREGAATASPKDKSSPSGFADAARKENYFSIFEKNSADLGSLDPAVVNDLTAFYTFLKSSRDATGSIARWNEAHYDASMKKDDLITIVYLCFLMALHGKLALERFIPSDRNRAIVENVFAGVLLQCFAFLDHVLQRDDFRFPRIEERRKRCEDLRITHRYQFGA